MASVTHNDPLGLTSVSPAAEIGVDRCHNSYRRIIVLADTYRRSETHVRVAYGGSW